LHIAERSRASSRESELSTDQITALPPTMGGLFNASDEKLMRLVAWNTEVLSSLLKGIVARRNSMISQPKIQRRVDFAAAFNGSGMVLDEVKDVITLPEFNAESHREQVDPESIKLDPDVALQLKRYNEWIASMYRYVDRSNV
jgi:hypothetical protein